MINILKRSDTLKFPTASTPVREKLEPDLMILDPNSKEIILTNFYPIFIGPITKQEKYEYHHNNNSQINTNPPIGLSQRKINSVPIVIDIPIENETAIESTKIVKSANIFVPTINKSDKKTKFSSEEYIFDRPLANSTKVKFCPYNRDSAYSPTGYNKSYPCKKYVYKEKFSYEEPKNTNSHSIDRAFMEIEPSNAKPHSVGRTSVEVEPSNAKPYSVGRTSVEVKPNFSPEIIINSECTPNTKDILDQNQNQDLDTYNKNLPNVFKSYNAVQKAKGSGIIPYSIIDGNIYFLLQKTDSPCKKKDSGWNDFGGKKNKSEHTVMTAAREFSEETSCLFYLKEIDDEESNLLYEKLKDNPTLSYDEESIEKLKKIINISEQFFFDKINAYVNPIYVSSKEIYISYIIKVKYIPITDIPRAEDLHIPYEDRYVRECKWFSLDEFMLLEEEDFHKRLQITKVKYRIKNYYEKGLLD